MFGRQTPAKPRPGARRPTVSVIIPCYNYGHYLPQAVASVLEQPGVDVDVLIIDDCSTDGSQEVVLRLAAEDDRVTAILHEKNARHIATYNEGLALARGDYVVLLSADDLLAPGSLSRACGLMERHASVGLVYGYAPEFAEIPPAFVPQRETWTVWRGRDWIARMCRRGTNMIVNPEAVVRGSVMRELVGYRADMPHAADMELWLRIAAISDVGRVNGLDQAYYRKHGSNMHLSFANGLLAEDMVDRREVFRTFLDEHPYIADRASLDRSASHAVALEAVRTATVVRARPEAGDGAQAELFAEFAAETYPPITRTLAWARWQWQRRRGRGTALASTFDQRIHQLRWTLRWRRWRRFGT
jgi:glycosyltransferase involved in cell wall biosynthesis